MADFAYSGTCRDQLVLFAEKLDQIIAPDHVVRLLDDILNRIDWKPWERLYDLRKGQPPIHPQVLAAAILYGLLKRIGTSRALEEAIEVRSDFRWLVQGRSIDHTTLSKFRQKNAEALKHLFVQVVLIARQMGHVPLASLGFDGTRLRADNRRSGTRTPEELRQAKVELAARFAELAARIAQADEADTERLGAASDHQLSQEMADVVRRGRRVEAALAEIARLEQAGETLPKRIPITDPQSRVTPNKEGGFAPNYTPTATVDIDSGLIVDANVIAHTDEDKYLIDSVQQVQQSYGLDSPPQELLADGMMSSGDNLAKCEALGIDFYSPIKLGCEGGNPAVREDPSQPVAASEIDRLPVTTTRHKDKTISTRFNKNAFVYDSQKNCYWCPAGKSLAYSNQTSQTENGRQRIRYRYYASSADCVSCPLAAKCLSANAERRQVGHEQHESLRIAHAAKMASPAGKAKYARRRHPGERPFAVIKQHFGARRFLTRGLAKVRQEWLWLSTAFNLSRLMSLIQSHADPPSKLSAVAALSNSPVP